LRLEVPVEHFVTVSALPPNVRFPADLAEKIRFDPATHRLIFRGFMSKAEFDRLSRLSDDWSYRRPLEDLFRLCMPDDPPSNPLARLFAAFRR
jgi:hypothetical protein